MKRIVLLGSTGSIGCNVLDVVSRHEDEFEIVGLAARSNSQRLARQCAQHREALLAITDEKTYAGLLEDQPGLKARAVGTGAESLSELIRRAKPDLVLNALVGFVGLQPTMAALSAGVPVAIANKETIVTGGEILLDAAKKAGTSLIPIDSEHVAVDQCLRSAPKEEIERVVMTASGGSLRQRLPGDFENVTVEEVLAHPTWDMGQKITVDSATLINKGLEVIEAHWLFEMPYEKIDVVIHPQSIVHSFEEFIDGSILAQMGDPDMRLPILYALSYPRRIKSRIRSSIKDFPELTFTEVNEEKYPGFKLALAAAAAGGNAPTILNAANEIAVEAFLGGKIEFRNIFDIIEGALGQVTSRKVTSLDDILVTDRETREWIGEKYPIKPTEVN